MIKKKRLLIFLLLLISSPVYGAGFEAGFYERVRYEFRKNLYDLDNGARDNRSFFKIKTSLWGKENFTKNSSLYLKLTNENIAYTYWGGASASVGKSADKKGYRYDINEVVFDNFYWDEKNLFGQPLFFRLGRQDLSDYGERFLLGEGTPVDSSRTFYFNAAKLSWQFDPKNTLDLAFIKDDKTDNMFPIINKVSPRQQLTSSDEMGGMLYYKSDAIKDLHLESYYIYKEEDASDSSTARMTKEKTELSTIGSFAQYKLEPWVLKGQLAYQFGSYGENDRVGLGGYGYLEREIKKSFWSPVFSLGLIYLSGDDPDTSTNEAWDPLFSRAPWVSDLYGQAYKSETETYYWTNLQMYRFSCTLSPTKKIKLSLGYNFLRANEKVAATASLFSGSGKNRGQLLQGKVDFNITKNISALIIGDYFIPGNFYVTDADDAIHIKSEIAIKF